MPNYDKEEVMLKMRKLGYKPVYSKDGKGLDHFKLPRGRKSGIKVLGYLNFLNVEAR